MFNFTDAETSFFKHNCETAILQKPPYTQSVKPQLSTIQ